jgi:hypothetical protein
MTPPEAVELVDVGRIAAALDAGAVGADAVEALRVDALDLGLPRVELDLEELHPGRGEPEGAPGAGEPRVERLLAEAPFASSILGANRSP